MSLSPSPALAMMQPRLPRAGALLPYLERIDDAALYSNWGPLCMELQARLQSKLAAPEHRVVCANSGFSALVGAILAHAGAAAQNHERTLAVIPSYTFTATAMAAVCCGYTPLLVDVEPVTWALHPDAVIAQAGIHWDRVGLVLPVAPYGRALHYASWVDFQRTHGVPVVLDAAASFEYLFDLPGWLNASDDVPVAVSFHATKTFGAAEGGAVIVQESLNGKVAAALNFGFFGSRQSVAEGINGKISEYHAAIGLAELDGWEDKKHQLHKTAQAYQAIFLQYALPHTFITWPDVAACYAFVEAKDAQDAERLIATLAQHGIETRRWYHTGLHRHPVYNNAIQAHCLRVTEDIGQRLIGVPLHFSMQETAMHRVCMALAHHGTPSN
jgi:dTDP-4-amino-4,6-dideoxygalactose transaminase